MNETDRIRLKELNLLSLWMNDVRGEMESNSFSLVANYIVGRVKEITSEHSPSGNYCSICNVSDQWCVHIKPPQRPNLDSVDRGEIASGVE